MPGCVYGVAMWPSSQALSSCSQPFIIGLDVKACVTTTFNMVSLILGRRTRLVA